MHSVPEWNAKSTSQDAKSFICMLNDLHQQLAREIESVDFASICEVKKPPSSVKRGPSRSKYPSKRTYKLTSSDICFSCEKTGKKLELLSKGKAISSLLILLRCDISMHWTECDVAGLLGEMSDALWLCEGTCRRSFHFKCLQPVNGKCEDCATGCHHCYQCGEGSNHLGLVVKCSLGICGRYYHIPCVMKLPQTNVLQGNWMPVERVTGDLSCLKFRCPLHYCHACGMSGANVYSVTCIRCPTAYHSR